MTCAAQPAEASLSQRFDSRNEGWGHAGFWWDGHGRRDAIADANRAGKAAPARRAHREARGREEVDRRRHQGNLRRSQGASASTPRCSAKSCASASRTAKSAKSRSRSWICLLALGEILATPRGRHRRVYGARARRCAAPRELVCVELRSEKTLAWRRQGRACREMWIPSARARRCASSSGADRR